MLYRRPCSVKQWNEIHRCSIRTYAHLWIVGPHGTGESCAAFAFAWSLDPHEWDVLWIHFSQPEDQCDCVWLEGGDKFSCVMKLGLRPSYRLETILNQTSQQRKSIVFLDGCTTYNFCLDEVTRTCKKWQEADKMKRSLVSVSFTRPRDCSGSRCHLIPSVAGESH
ncbi:hypothetical protein PINS_up003072 [Pythium insidiosum]|nr:hypothetical protein PINS_up003072 [Pythium insidiosum]